MCKLHILATKTHKDTKNTKFFTQIHCYNYPQRHKAHKGYYFETNRF
jgi:hypothetical protein